MNPNSSDCFWENQIYSQGQHLNLYPFDCVVTFIFRYSPRESDRSSVGICELGCGAANNLWFAAREGFRVAGIDGSSSAIEFAKNRFAREGLRGDLRVGDFTQLPWGNEVFDLVIDRGSLTCASLADQRKAVDEAHRVLRPGGHFFYNGYSDLHTSAQSGRVQPDGRLKEIVSGSLAGVDNLCFSARHEVESLFASGWQVVKFEQLGIEELFPERNNLHAEWRVIVRKN